MIVRAIVVNKASATGDQEVAPVVLQITGDASATIDAIPDQDFEAKAEGYYVAQAELVFQALQALPGGTRHQLLSKLLLDHQMLFRVPLRQYAEEKQEEPPAPAPYGYHIRRWQDAVRSCPSALDDVLLRLRTGGAGSVAQQTAGLLEALTTELGLAESKPQQLVWVCKSCSGTMPAVAGDIAGDSHPGCAAKWQEGPAPVEFEKGCGPSFVKLRRSQPLWAGLPL